MKTRLPPPAYALSTLLIGLLIMPAAVGADSLEQRQDRPSIGLVLGGGGARGAAHIGVLRELENLRVPVDAIVGTSMGAIVGGLYASGMTPAELERLIESLDWKDSFYDTSKREDMSFRRKQDDEAYPIRLELGLRDGGLVLPRGLISGQKLTWILREQTLRVSGVTDFDDLPIPFRAVASDIETGESYVMSKGDLVDAMRASASVPGIFSPVEVDGRTLVDGGLTGNVPVDAMRAMGVDIIIAVDVEFPLYPPEQLESALQVTEQMLTILIRKETLRQLAGLGENDILIRPDLGLLASSAFEQITDAVQPGAEATVALRPRLDSLALDAESYAAYKEARRADYAQPHRLAFVRVQDEGPLSRAVLDSHIQVKAGDPVDPERFADDAKRLYGLGVYEQVGYRLVTEEDRVGVEFQTMPKSWGPNILQFGISVEDDFEGSTAFNVSTRLTKTGINAYGAEWRTDGQIGTDPRITSEFYLPISADSRFFVAPRITLDYRNFNAFTDSEAIARYRISEAEAALEIGREFGRWGEFRVGVKRGTGEARVKVGDPALSNIDFDSGGFFARFGYDTLDDAQIPLDGTRLGLEWNASQRGLGADNHFDTIEAELTSVRTSGKNSWLFGLNYATTLDGDVTIQDFFPLGGFLRLSGMKRGEISGPHAGVARLVYYRRTGDTGGLLDMPYYFGASIETGNVWQRRSDIGTDSLIVYGSLFAGLDTYIGPLFFGAGIGEGGESNFYLFLGAPPR